MPSGWMWSPCSTCRRSTGHELARCHSCPCALRVAVRGRHPRGRQGSGAGVGAASGGEESPDPRGVSAVQGTGSLAGRALRGLSQRVGQT
uniref:Uncharacterized protein n=1 Tax=uncultured marine virus TaxID=186617 RepID=A0A0F7L3T6_9VIRU|nr:hypothetical protein [uncultured marine virus]